MTVLVSKHVYKFVYTLPKRGGGLHPHSWTLGGLCLLWSTECRIYCMNFKTKIGQQKPYSFCQILGSWLWEKPFPCKDFDYHKTSPSWSRVQALSGSPAEPSLQAQSSHMWVKLFGALQTCPSTSWVFHKDEKNSSVKPYLNSWPVEWWGIIIGWCFNQLSFRVFCLAAIDNWNSPLRRCRIYSMVG